MKHLCRLSLMLVLLALTPIRMVGAVAGPRVVVVVAKGSPITNISKAELRRVFLTETTVVDGNRVVPFNFVNKSPQRTAFDQVVLGMSPDEVGRLWVDRKIRGQRPPPRAVPSAVYMAKVVQVFSGALGYLNENELPAYIQPVAVDGLDYRNPQYSLK